MTRTDLTNCTFLRTSKALSFAKRSASRGAIIAGLIAGGATPAFAASDGSAPTVGDTVTCTVAAPNPETDPIIAPGSVNVTVEMQEGAILQAPTSPAMHLGGGAKIDMGGATISDVDPAAIPASIAGVIAGDFSSVVTRQDFTELFTGIGALAPLQPATGATVELGATEDAALQAGIENITGVVTVQKAKMADQAMNAITQFITSAVDPNAGLPTDGPFLMEPGTNQVIVSGSQIIAGGAVAISLADNSATRAVVSDGGIIASLVEGAPAISMGENSALHVTLGEYDETTPSGGTILTVGDGAAGIDAGQDDSAVMVYMLGDGHVFTAGDNAPAIIGPGTSSVLAFEARGGLSSDGLPMIATFGDNSPGLVMHGADNSTATLQMRDMYAGEFGPGMQTNGANSTLFDIDTGSGSSVSFSVVASTLGTYGDKSGVIRIAQDGSSDALVFVQSSSLTSTGAGSALINLSTTGIGSSLITVAIINGTLASEGDGSAGILLGGGFDSSSQTFFIADSTVDTLGDDAPAIDLGRSGSSSVRSTTILDTEISTAGDRSGGILGEETGNGSASELTMRNVSVATLGDDAPALALIGSGDGSSAFLLSIAESSFTTEGANSHGIRIGGGGQDSSVMSLDFSDTLISTLGTGADALRVDVALADDDSVTVIDLATMDISTAGDGARGIVLGGSLTGGSVNSSISIELTNSTIETLGDNANGFDIAGFSGDFVNSDWSVFVGDMDIATSGAGSIGLSLRGIDGLLDRSPVTRIVEDVRITTQGDDAVGLYVGGMGIGGINDSPTQLALTAIDIATSGANAHGLVLGAGLTNLDGTTDISIATTGAGSTGFLSSAGAGQAITINNLRMTVSTEGSGSAGMVFEMEDDFTAIYTDMGAEISTLGDDSPGIVFGEGGTDNFSRIMFDSHQVITTTGDRSPGYLSGGIGSGAGDAFMGVAGHTVQVDTSGNDSPGVIFNVLGNMENTQEAVLIDISFTVDTLGERSPGVIFGQTRADTPSTLISSFQASDIGAVVTTAGDDSPGFFFGPGATPSGNEYTVAAVAIHSDVVTTGNNSHGVIFTEGLSKAGPGTNVKITMTNLPLRAMTFGSNSHGIILGDGLGTTRTDMNFKSALLIGDGMSATTSGANSHALVISENSALTLDLASVIWDPATATYSGPIASNGLMVTGTIDSFDTFVATGANSRAVMNHGILYGTFTVGAGVVGNLGSTGLIESNAAPAIELHGDAIIELLNGSRLLTSGDDAPGILINNNTAGAMATLSATGSTLQTNGADSTLVDVNLGDGSSLSFSAENTSFGTVGDGSGVLSLSVADNSDMLLFVSDSTLTSLGNNATLLETSSGDGTVVNVVVIGSTFETQGVNSAAISLGGVGTGSAMNASLTGGIVLNTQGDNSAGLLVPGLTGIGDLSATSFNMSSASVETLGAGSAGIVIGNPVVQHNNSSVAYSLNNITVDSEGDHSTGIAFYGPGNGMGSDATLFLTQTSITTLGDNATGLLVDMFGANATNSVSQVIMDDITVATSGANSHGIVLGAGLGTDRPDINTEAFLAVAMAATTSGDNAHALVLSESTTLSLAGQSHIGATTANGTVVNGIIDSFDGFEATGTNSRAVMNRGILYGTFTVDDAVVGNLGNNGLIESATGAGGVAVQFTGTTDDIFELQTQGVVIGTVEAGAGNDLFALGGEGSASFDFGLIGTQYNDFESFEKIGSSTWTMTGISNVEAGFAVHAGVLLANGSLGGLDFTVHSGAVLGGTGTLGNVVSAGGTFAPGNSIGTITVNGDFTLDAASVLEIEVSPDGSSDLVVVNGAVELGGATLSVIEGGSFGGADPFNYLIIDNDAADPVGGTFGAVENDLAFLTPSVQYDGGDGNDVVLTLTPKTTPTPTPTPPPLFPTAAETWNQQQAASVLDTFGAAPGSDAENVYLDILFMSGASARAAFDAASGEIYASVLADTALAGMAQAERMLARAHSGTGEGWALWLGGTARKGHLAGDGNAARVDGENRGAELGFEYRGAGNGWAIGAAAGYLDGDVAVPGSSSGAEYDGWTLGAYARFGTGNAGLSASAAIDHASLDLGVWRQVVLGAVNRMASSAVDLDSLSLAGELRYGFAVGGGWAAGPLGSVRHARVDLGSFAETGAGSLNLASSGGDDSVTRWGGGAFVNWQGERGNLDLSAQYVDGEDIVAQLGLSMAGAPGEDFTVRAPQAEGQALLLALAGGLELGGGWGLGANLQWLTRTKLDNLSASLTITLGF
ncbi:hypothetical protein M3P36_10910 [Altererythrobacter sp. KTW20L]|uniref:autotransporter outer membrane beta-barrel domain-containing protein n=1 Tax=Altererythrobacter sp. KTW20L TaxID=2942210 RepID=UPI0020C185CF|nr:autotransporter outer membrane beta-barrel domain-containing protein [Altererythrobacter sp. KTW20L]MCL6251545.1 hypothetical protein [Altererythrobacter sp. KTW20L]